MRIPDQDWSISANPLRHPGDIPEIRDSSFLFHVEEYFKLDVAKGRKLGQSTILFDPSRNRADFPREREKLDNHFARNRLVAMANRYPVVAYGTLQNPAHLRTRYSDRLGSSDVIPYIQGELTGIVRTLAPYITTDGIIPYTLYFLSPTQQHFAANLRVPVMFLDKYQLEIVKDGHKSDLDRPEGYYELHEVDGSKYKLRLNNDEYLTKYYVFISKVGILKSVFKDQLGLYDFNSIDFYSRNKYMKILTRFFELCFNEKCDVMFAVQQLQSNAKLRKKFSEWLQAEYSTPSETVFDSRGTDHRQIYQPPITYSINACKCYSDEGACSWASPASDGLIARKNYERPVGDYAVVMPRNIAEENFPDYWRIKYRMFFTWLPEIHHQYIAIKPTMETLSRLATFARLLVDSENSPAADVKIDKTLRVGIGIEPGEAFEIARVKQRNFFKRLPVLAMDMLIERHYFVFRTQIADVTLDEKVACAIPKIALEMMGINEGDEIVIEMLREGENSTYEIVEAVAKVYIIPEDMIAMREKIQKSIEATSHPDCSELLGVYPDIPWIFIDEDIFVSRNLPIQQCMPVRVRARRIYQIWNGSRNMLIILAFALLGSGFYFQLNRRTQIDSIGFGIFLGVLIIASLFGFQGLRQRLAPAPQNPLKTVLIFLILILVVVTVVLRYAPQ